MNTNTRPSSAPDSTDVPKGSSNRSFGLVFATVFAIIGLWPLMSGGPIRDWAMIVAGVLVVISFAIPSILTWPNRLWTRFGLLLHRVTNPIILGILFLLVFVPMALWLRIARRQPIRRLSDEEETFWHKPDSGTVNPDSFRKLY